jgi:hypothetical protein
MSLYENHPDSSVIRYVCWEKESELMLVLFHTKSMFLYFSVPEEVYFSLISSDSIGSYFNKNIRNSYKYTKFASTSEVKKALEDA